MQWYYLDANKQQVPFDENYVQALVHDGTVNAETLFWNETLSKWQSGSASFPQVFGAKPSSPPEQSQAIVAPAGTGDARASRLAVKSTGAKVLNHDLRELVKDLASYISANAGWIRFLGVMLIISGVVNLILLYGAFFIWLGVILTKVAKQAEIALQTGTQESLEECLFQLGRFFKINGIVLLVILILYVVAIVAVLSLGLLAPLLGGSLEAGL